MVGTGEQDPRSSLLNLRWTQGLSEEEAIHRCIGATVPSYHFAGRSLLRGIVYHHTYNHVVVPNVDHMDAVFTYGGADYNTTCSLVTARSQHSGGVNLCRADGSSGFVSETIDLATWRALGTRSAD
jgi:hypothetical protein